MSLDPRVLDLIQSLYDAAIEQAHWPDALQKMADFTGSQSATFWVLDSSETARLPTFIYVNLDPALIETYLAEMTPLDPTVQYLVRHPNQPIVHDGLVITEREKNRHPYYAWHARLSDERFRLVGQMSPAPALHAGVALHRVRRAGRYEPKEIEQFRVLHKHIERALAVAFRLGTLDAVQQWSLDLLDRNAAAVLLLDAHRTVVYANRRAAELGSIGDGVELAAHLKLARAEDDKPLQRLIDDALLAAASGAASERVRTMRASRPSGKRPYAILVAPVTVRPAPMSTIRAAVWISIVDPEHQSPLSKERLREAFGLTEAEARLAALLGAGQDVRCAAERLGITYGTARARLKTLFDKTQTRRQAELIRLLLSIAGWGP
ncbi:MAG TPA: hypothetical protein VFY39_15125 [Gammaproteobacteria bacterium]|nr:hypothetical protein [Gammaproteobacteria bacterium]